MPQHERYLLQIWRSRAVGGWQWVARVEHLADGRRCRFADPEELLEHLRDVAFGSSDRYQPNVEPPEKIFREE